jgi:hypothetical protein
MRENLESQYANEQESPDGNAGILGYLQNGPVVPAS